MAESSINNDAVDAFGRSLAAPSSSPAVAASATSGSNNNNARSKSRSRSPDSDSNHRRRGGKSSGVSSKRGRSRSGSRGRSRSRSRSRSRRRSGSPSSKRRRSSRRGGSRDRDSHRGDVLMSFKEFFSREDDDVSLEESQKNYEKYKQEVLQRSYKRFFDRRWQDDWFQEKYSTARVNQSKRDSEAAVPLFAAEFKSLYDENKLAVFLQLDIADKEEKDDTAEIKDGEDEKTRNDRITAIRQSWRKLRGEEHARREVAEPFLRYAIHFKSVPLYVTRAALHDLCKAQPGFKRLVLTDADMSDDWSRAGLAYYDSEATAKAAWNVLKESNLQLPDAKPWKVRVRAHDKLFAKKAAPAATLENERVEKDLEQARLLARHLDSEKSITDNTLLADGSADASQPPLRRLNTIIHYLRTVHYYCYYCSSEYASVDAITSACGEIHLRSETVTSANDTATTEWFTKLDAAISERLATTRPWPSPPLVAPDVVADREPVVVPEDEKVEIVIADEDKQKDTNLAKLQLQWYIDNVKKKSAAKFKCELCAKMFRAPPFVQKHLDTKHDDEWKKLVAKTLKAELEITYMADANRPTEPPLESKSGGGGRSSRRDRSRDRRDSRRSPDRRGHHAPPPYGAPMHPPPYGWPAAPYGHLPPPPMVDAWGNPLYPAPPPPVRYDDRRDSRRDDRDRDRRSSRRSPDRGDRGGDRNATPKKTETRSIRSYADLDSADDSAFTIDYGLQNHQYQRNGATPVRGSAHPPDLHPAARHFPPLPGRAVHGGVGVHEMPQYFGAPVGHPVAMPGVAPGFAQPPPGLAMPPYGLPPPNGMPPIMPPHM